MKKDAKFIFIIVSLLLACMVSWSYYFRSYSQKDTYDINAFPKTIGSWQSEDMEITEEEFAILETRNAFARRYFNPEGKEVIAYIIYSQNNRKVSHPPELCYTGAGATIISHTPFSIPAPNNTSIDSQKPVFPILTNRLLIEQGRAQEVVFYWFKVGNSFIASYWKQQLLIAFKTLTGKPSSSAMIRISANTRGGLPKAESDCTEFIQLITPTLFKYLP
jgi:EpsI family protein